LPFKRVNRAPARGVRYLIKMTQTPKATEERLQEIKRAAADGTLAIGDPAKSKGHPQIAGHDSYYGLPLLKPPLWTWEVPLYFFIGGVSGISACMAFAAQLFEKDPAMIRALLWMALIGAAICPALLISDLGRPSRFLNMLRVFKLKSAMSVGAWVLTASGGGAFLAVAGNELILHGLASPWVISLRWAGLSLGAIAGLLLASYTAVLIGATAIPVWSQNRTILPVHFLTSGLGCSAGILELMGFLIPATQVLGFVAAGIETALEVLFEVRRPPVNAPLHRGKTGMVFRVAGMLEGPSALLVRVFFGSVPWGRWTAAICFLAGALVSRYAWIAAGRASAKDPEALFQIQRKKPLKTTN
jgi:hypothetical protein